MSEEYSNYDNIKRLSDEELEKLWSDYFADRENKKLRDELIVQYIYLTRYVIGRIKITLPPSFSIEDIASYGVEGLIDSIEKYTPQKGTKFESYALIRIRGNILDKIRSQNWIPRSQRKKINDIKLKNYNGRQEETTIQRKIILHEWFRYLLEENNEYTNSVNLMILDGIGHELSKNNDSIPPFLNKEVLKATIDEISRILKYHPKEIINFNKKYQTNLQKKYIEEFSEIDTSEITENMTGWIVIPSKENDPEHYEENIQKLKTMSLNSWCTKNFSADAYLSLGDFHIYLENGKTKLGVRFEGDTIYEIQGEKNSTRIPIKYLDIVNEHIE